MLAYLLTSLCPANPGVEWLLPTNVTVLGNSADSITRAKNKCGDLPKAKIRLYGVYQKPCTSIRKILLLWTAKMPLHLYNQRGLFQSVYAHFKAWRSSKFTPNFSSCLTDNTVRVHNKDQLVNAS
jgi:hypothetical protein